MDNEPADFDDETSSSLWTVSTPAEIGQWETVVPEAPGAAFGCETGMQAVMMALLPDGTIIIMSGSNWRNRAPTQTYPEFNPPKNHKGVFIKDELPFDFSNLTTYYSIVNSVARYNPETNEFHRLPHLGFIITLPFYFLMVCGGGNAVRATIDVNKPQSITPASPGRQPTANLDRIQRNVYFFTDSSGEGIRGAQAETWVLEIFHHHILLTDGSRRSMIQSLEWEGTSSTYEPCRNWWEKYTLLHSNQRYHIKVNGTPEV